MSNIHRPYKSYNTEELKEIFNRNIKERRVLEDLRDETENRKKAQKLHTEILEALALLDKRIKENTNNSLDEQVFEPHQFNQAVNTERFKSSFISKLSPENREIGWKTELNSNSFKGFNDSAMEHFKEPVMGLARELTQNSLDASRERSRPVIIDVKLHTVGFDDIPNANELFNQIEAAKNTYLEEESNPDEKVINFYNKAENLLKSKSIPVLEFSDYNTTGMKNNETKKLDNIFYTYMKTEGYSNKPEDGLGSFGIGKTAPIAASALRTIIVSSCYEDDDYIKQVTQGKSVLNSVYDRTNDTFSEKEVYWGIKDKQLNLDGFIENLSPVFQRVKNNSEDETYTGSTISIVGFPYTDNWMERLVYAFTQNFFSSIYNNKLIVNIGNNSEYVINSESILTIPEFCNIKKIPGYDKQAQKDFELKYSYLEALNSEERKVIPLELESIGDCRLTILLRKDLKKKICFLRGGMLITDELNGLKQFTEFKDFVAVFECLDAKGNKFLTKMEPPEHNTFDAAILERNYPELYAAGKKALNEIKLKVRDALRVYAYEKVEETAYIDDLNEYFEAIQDSGELEDDDADITEVNPYGEISIKLKSTPIAKRKRRKPKKGDEGQEVEVLVVDEDEGEEEDEDTPETETNGNGGNRTNTKPTKIDIANTATKTTLDKFRIFSDKNKTHVFFDYSKDKKLQLNFYLQGITEKEPLAIQTSSQGEIKEEGKSIEIEVEKDKRNNFEVSFEKKVFGSIEVEAYEV